MFKDKIAELRENANMTANAFARSIGVSVSSLSYYLSGKIIPRQNVIDAICRKYNVTPEWLMEEDSAAADTVAANVISLDEVPAAEKTPAAEKASADKKTPAARKASADKKAPAARKASADKKAPAAEKAPVTEKAPAKAAKVKEKQKGTGTDKKSSAARARTRIYIQSQHGASISVDDILEKVNAVVRGAERIYAKPEENRAYWVSGASSGSVALWE